MDSVECVNGINMTNTERIGYAQMEKANMLLTIPDIAIVARNLRRVKSDEA